MHRRLEQVRSTGKAVIQEIRREDITFMAASIAYHAFVSMLPILVLLMLVVSLFGGEQFEATVITMTSAMLPESGRQIVAATLRNANSSVGLSVVGVGVLLWGTSKIFRAMDAAFAEIYDTERMISLYDQFRDALVVLLALAVAVVGMVVLGSYVRVPGSIPLSSVFNALIAVVGLSVAFAPIYYVFPNVDVSFREVIPGVLVAAVGWVALKWVFNLYVSVSSKPDLYGLVGTLVLLVTWLYVGGLVLLVGAAVNSTLAGRSGNRATDRHGKRRFGRQITDIDSFSETLDEVVEEADDADVSRAKIRNALLRKSTSVEHLRDGSSERQSAEETSGHR